MTSDTIKGTLDLGGKHKVRVLQIAQKCLEYIKEGEDIVERHLIVQVEAETPLLEGQFFITLTEEEARMLLDAIKKMEWRLEDSL